MFKYRISISNYRKGKERYIPNELGSLYVDTNKLNNNERPIIYIAGQGEHRGHVLEQISGVSMEAGHSMFTGNWVYDYPILFNNKKEINGENFAKNFTESLKLANLNDVDIITSSYGGIIASLASKNNRIHKIYAIHPPILGTPLANPEEMAKYKKLFTSYERLLLLILKRVVDKNYGFEINNYNGVDLRKVNLNKLIVIGSSIDPNKEKGLALTMYDMIKKATNLENDCMVIFDEDKLNSLGINYIKEKDSISHFNSGTKEEISKAYRLSKKIK